MVAIIFFWTPPHFWALSLSTTDDYERAGVPMMPVAEARAARRGCRSCIYSLILAPLALAPAFTGLGGWLYLAVAALGGLAFVALAVRLANGPAETETRATPGRLFGFSILYLFALFAALLVERRSTRRRRPSSSSGPDRDERSERRRPQAAAARRGRNIAIALSLAAFVVLVFVITLIKKSGG